MELPLFITVDTAIAGTCLPKCQVSFFGEALSDGDDANDRSEPFNHFPANYLNKVGSHDAGLLDVEKAFVKFNKADWDRVDAKYAG